MSNRWKSIDPVNTFSLPAEPGCYVVYLDGKLSYIGQAKNMRSRFYDYGIRYSYSNSTITPWGYFQEVIVKYRKPKHFGEWAMTELRLIRRHQPPLNCVGSTRKRGAA